MTEREFHVARPLPSTLSGQRDHVEIGTMVRNAVMRRRGGPKDFPPALIDRICALLERRGRVEPFDLRVKPYDPMILREELSAISAALTEVRGEPVRAVAIGLRDCFRERAAHHCDWLHGDALRAFAKGVDLSMVAALRTVVGVHAEDDLVRDSHHFIDKIADGDDLAMFRAALTGYEEDLRTRLTTPIRRALASGILGEEGPGVPFADELARRGARFHAHAHFDLAAFASACRSGAARSVCDALEYFEDRCFLGYNGEIAPVLYA